MQSTVVAFLVFAGFAQAQNIAVIAHRGEHLSHIENTLPAFRAAYAAGADFFECDVRTTADGKLVLMHDATVDRTTKGHGEVAKMTLAELRALGVTTFDEALAFAQGKTNVYIDSKQVSPAAVVAAIRAHHMEEHVVVYGDPEYLRAVFALENSLRMMPEARDAAHLRALMEPFGLEIAAFDASDFNEATLAVARDAKIGIFVDRLGAADNETSWQDAIERGATGIQTDHPAELVQFLRARKRHR